MKIYIENLEKMNRFARELGKLLKNGDVVLLNGNLGAGKTTLVKAMKDVFDIKENISSPSFSIVNIYNGKEKIYHMDFYRFNSPHEIESLDYMSYFYPDGISIIEWSDKVSEYLPDDAIDISIEILKEGRRIEILENTARKKEIVEGLNENFIN